MVQLDAEFVRSQVPAFSEPSLEGWGFFENAGGSYTCRQVIAKLNDYYTQTKVQPYYNYPASQKAGEAMDESYRRFAAYLNVSENEVQFGPSTTQNLSVLSHAFRELWSEGDEIIVTELDHHANIDPWRALARERGVTVHTVRMIPETG